MRVLRDSWRNWESAAGDASVTIGVLDGVHLGHRDLIGHLGNHYLRTVLTFEPHPVEVLRPGTKPRLITTIDERLSLLEEVGVEQVGVLDLADIKELAPVDFVKSVLVDKLAAARLVVGVDFQFGKDRAGDVIMLRDLGATHGFEVDAIELVGSGVGVVSSSRIRALIEEGRVGEAADLMGSRYQLTNLVVDGDKRGLEIGFPTANLLPPIRKVIPGMGVYAAFASVAGETFQAAVNVGVRPTFGGGNLVVEAFLLDFEEDIYGEELTLSFVEFLRPELEFDRVGDLVARMRLDVEEAREMLDAASPVVS